MKTLSFNLFSIAFRMETEKDKKVPQFLKKIHIKFYKFVYNNSNWKVKLDQQINIKRVSL